MADKLAYSKEYIVILDLKCFIKLMVELTNKHKMT